MIALKNEMIQFYNRHSYSHVYIYGFRYNHKVYSVTADNSIMSDLLTLSKASRGQGYALRFRPSRAVKKLLLEMGAELLCSEDYFTELVESSKYNKGEIFEKLVTERSGQHWEKDSVPFTDDGDLTVDGIAYQIKFEGATFINEGQIARMRAGK